ncbi:MAG TPA: response regulator [Ignavibacteriaceae bacterium]|nr:response regulator [Ignavibacteriaceae bacterium]
MLKKTVLIAEDNGIISLDLKILLKKFNIDSEVIRDPGFLFEKTRLLRPDLIIADLNLKDKQQVKDALSEISRTYHIPIIIITSSLKTRVNEFAGGLSSCSVLSEPFDTSELLLLIQKYIFFEPMINYCRT